MKIRVFWSLMLVAGGTSSAALAQSQVSSEPGDQNEILVIATGQSKATSASKAETPLIESPQTISIISREEMDVRAVASLGDAVAYTAGVRAEAAGIDSRTDEISVRGFAAGGFSSNNNFIDGLRLPSGGQFTRTQFDPFALQQVEVLKGPSGVLYGQTAPGGIINMVSKRPTSDFHGELMLQAAGFTDLGRWQFQAAGDVSGALNSAGTISARLVGLARDGKTQIKETSNQRYYISPSITFAPTEDISWTLLGQYQRDQGGSTYQFLPMTGTLLPSNGRRLALDEYIGEPDWNQFDRDQILIGSFLNARLNDRVTFRSNVRYTRIKTLYRVSVLSGDTVSAAQCATYAEISARLYGGCIPGQTIGRRAIQADGKSDGIAIDNQLQGEFSTGPLHHTVLGGVDYFYTDWTHYRDGVTLPDIPRQLPDGRPNPLFGQVEPLIDMYNPVRRGSANYASLLTTPQGWSNTKSDQLGLYIQDQIAVGKLRVSLGGRKDWAYDKVLNLVNNGVQRTKADAFTGRVGAVYLFDNGFAPYVSYAESFVPQAGDPTTNVTGEPFVPTTGQQYEAGLRFEPRGSSAYFTLGGYEIKQQNILTPDPLGKLCGNSVCNVQTGEVRIRGIELEAKAQTRIGLTLIGSVTRNWSEITKSNTADLGKDMSQVPNWLASAFVDYRLPEGTIDGLGIGGGVRYTGKMFGNTANTIVVPDYTLFDLFLRYDFGRAAGEDGLSFSLNARNLTNKTYVALCTGSASCYYGSGRAVTARIQYRW